MKYKNKFLLLMTNLFDFHFMITVYSADINWIYDVFQSLSILLSISPDVCVWILFLGSNLMTFSY